MMNQRRFAADVMLGRVARYLIHAGFDCAYDKTITDRELANQARRENRILLTRDRDLVEYHESQRLFLLENSSLGNQLDSLRQAFRLQFREDRFFTRCSSCNRSLRKISKQEAAESIPKQTKKWIDEYFRCPDCERIYWRGTHYREVLDQFRQWGLLANS
jgi:uncharacterized protein with PIN domain